MSCAGRERGRLQVKSGTLNKLTIKSSGVGSIVWLGVYDEFDSFNLVICLDSPDSNLQLATGPRIREGEETLARA
jgi:hypothetical protein